MSEPLDAEDAKLVRLARLAMTRAHTPGGEPAQGAAVRDSDGRTYAAATLGHPDAELATSAVRGALSAAYSSGARRFEALAVVGPWDGPDRRLAAELAPGAAVLLVDERGQVRREA